MGRPFRSVDSGNLVTTMISDPESGMETTNERDEYARQRKGVSLAGVNLSWKALLVVMISGAVSFAMLTQFEVMNPESILAGLMETIVDSVVPDWSLNIPSSIFD